jgi:hypothetical protein
MAAAVGSGEDGGRGRGHGGSVVRDGEGKERRRPNRSFHRGVRVGSYAGGWVPRGYRGGYTRGG